MCRQSLKYQGLFWRHEEPLLITGVEGGSWCEIFCSPADAAAVCFSCMHSPCCSVQANTALAACQGMQSPFFAITGVDEHGEHFHYSARRHRTGQPMLHEILARQEDTQHQRAQAWWACFAFWRYHETPDTALAWWSGLAFILGGLLFAISGLAGSIRGVSTLA